MSEPYLRPRSLLAATCAAGVTLVGLDLLWLGVVARDWYAATLGAWQAPSPHLGASVLFYVLYLAVVVHHAVRQADFVAHAAWRGAGVGLLAYGTWDLTNLAVLRDWPARLVPVDWAWGIVLTAAVAAVARAVLERVEEGRP
jgi:uncharacterized membrane protein